MVQRFWQCLKTETLFIYIPRPTRELKKYQNEFTAARQSLAIDCEIEFGIGLVLLLLLDSLALLLLLNFNCGETKTREVR